MPHVTHWRCHTAVGLLAAVPSCLQALPIFLDRLVSPVTAIVLSVTVVLVFGELSPARGSFSLIVHAPTQQTVCWLARRLVPAKPMLLQHAQKEHPLGAFLHTG